MTLFISNSMSTSFHSIGIKHFLPLTSRDSIVNRYELMNIELISKKYRSQNESNGLSDNLSSKTPPNKPLSNLLSITWSPKHTRGWKPIVN